MMKREEREMGASSSNCLVTVELTPSEEGFRRETKFHPL